MIIKPTTMTKQLENLWARYTTSIARVNEMEQSVRASAWMPYTVTDRWHLIYRIKASAAIQLCASILTIAMTDKHNAVFQTIETAMLRSAAVGASLNDLRYRKNDHELSDDGDLA